MGDAASRLGGGSEIAPNVDKTDIIEELTKAVETTDLVRYKEIWSQSWSHRQRCKEEGDMEFDKDLVAGHVINYVKFAFRHNDSEWRFEGIKVAESFLDNKDMRQEYIKHKFLEALLFIDIEADTGAEDKLEEVGTPRGKDLSGGGKDSKQTARLKLAANIMCKLADYEEFKTKDLLCSPATLNFLCIVLNQAPDAAEVVTRVFVKLCSRQTQDSLQFLVDASVGDILAAFFATIQIRRPAKPSPSAMEKWRRDVGALGNTAHTLGTMIKYGHQLQVQTPTIIQILAALSASKHGDDAPDNVRVLAGIARLLYWICRHAGTGMAAKLHEAASPGRPQQDPDEVLQVLVRMWNRCVNLHMLIQERRGIQWAGFCTDDLDRSKRLDSELDRQQLDDKTMDAKRLICYTNCLLWLCLPMPGIRWKMREASLRKLHIAFELRSTGDEDLLKTTLSTVRYLVDMPLAQKCVELFEFFAVELLSLLDVALQAAGQGDQPAGHGGEVVVMHRRLLLETISVLSMQRGMQQLLTENGIWDKLKHIFADKANRYGAQSHELDLIDSHQDEVVDQREKLVALYLLAEVAVHPSNRLKWASRMGAMPGPGLEIRRGPLPPKEYPPRENEFQKLLQDYIVKDRSDKPCQTVGSLLLYLFQESKFQQGLTEAQETIKSLFKWWRDNSTINFEEEYFQEAEETLTGIRGGRSLPALLDIAIRRREQRIELASIVTMQMYFPHECVLVLSLFSRLALEPEYKRFFVDHIDALLGCVCVGIWAEAREAAATLANLMWMPDFRDHSALCEGKGSIPLVCWLKFDGPCCVNLDAANVLLPYRSPVSPKPVDTGKGMYRSRWGVEFVEDSCLTLHPNGLKTNLVPAILTSASPQDTLEALSCQTYDWLVSKDTLPHPKHFSITCWFYWSLASTEEERRDRVLITSTPIHGSREAQPLVFMHWERDSSEWVWIFVEAKDDTERLVRTPKLLPGWHSLAIVSSNEGTRFHLDTDFSITMKHIWLRNDFYMVGNDGPMPPRPNSLGKTDASEGATGHGGKKPFGLIADFRIYGQSLSLDDVKVIAQADTKSHPNEIARVLADKDAAKILAQRLDVPDSAAECLRALGSLATLASERAKIYKVCGRELLKMLDSPLPMIQRQATRLLNNMT